MSQFISTKMLFWNAVKKKKSTKCEYVMRPLEICQLWRNLNIMQRCHELFVFTCWCLKYMMLRLCHKMDAALSSSAFLWKLLHLVDYKQDGTLLSALSLFLMMKNIVLKDLLFVVCWDLKLYPWQNLKWLWEKFTSDFFFFCHMGIWYLTYNYF